jgi:hypothetical protein
MIDRLGKTGSAYKTAAQEAVDIGDEKIVRFGKEQRVESVKDEASSIAGTEETAKALAKEVGLKKKEARYVAEDIVESLSADTTSQAVKDRATKIFSKRLAKGDIASTYGDMTKALNAKYNDTYNIDGNIISNMKGSLDETMARGGNLTVVERNLSEMLEQPMTMDNVLNIKKETAKLVDKSSGIQKVNAVKLRGAVDKVLKETLSESDYKLFKDMDIEYTNRMSVVGRKDKNKIGIKLMEFANGRKTLDSILSDLDKINVGSFDFKELEKIVGTKNMAKLEAGIVNNMLNKNVDDVSWGVISKSLDKMGFVSKEGQELKKVINKFDNVFSADNLKIILDPKFDAEKDVVALTADLLAKMKYTASSMIFKKIKSKFMMSKEYDNIRAVREIGDILSGKKVYVKGVEIPKTEVEKIARESIKTAYKEQIKAIGEEGSVNPKEIEEAVDRGMSNLGLGKTYGGKPTVGGKPTDSKYKSLSESLEARKPIDEKSYKPQEGYGMKSKYGGKATSSGGVNTPEAKAQLKRFLDDIANPKVDVKTDKIQDLYDSLKSEGTTMYGATVNKEKAWNKAMEEVNKILNKKSVSPKERDKMIQAVKDYYDLIDDTI